jgi:hypothetical protein
VWTAERIRALGIVTTVPVAAAIFGLSPSVAYELIRADAFPVPVLRFDSRYRLPVRAILTARPAHARRRRPADADWAINSNSRPSRAATAAAAPHRLRSS